ncbi:Alpha/Beta hydrolase protein [Globomyces pollinis-pini]|nr:Alpha/Beta hydrolase protein [Globomyces pollinis-pini]
MSSQRYSMYTSPSASKSSVIEPPKLNLVITDDTTNEKSSVRKLLDDRYRNNQKFPLPTTNAKTVAMISTMRKFLNIFKNQVDFSKMVASGRKTTLPSSLKATITKVTIPRFSNIVIDGYDLTEEKGEMNAEWIQYAPDKESDQRVIIYIHGGAYFLANRRTHRPITWRLAKYARARVLSIDYRLAPENAFPLPLVDVLSAYQYLLQVKYQPHQISFVGDSAGGGLTMSALIYCRDTGLLPMPGAIACMSPYMDLTHSLPSWHLNQPYCYLPNGVYDPKYLNDTRSNLAVNTDKELLHPFASPAFSKKNDRNLCPTLIQMGDCERIRDDSIYFSEFLYKDQPIQLEMYEDSVHVFQLFSPFDKFSKHALLRIGEFLRKYTGNEPETQLEHVAYKVLHQPGFPVQRIDDLVGVLSDGAQILIERGIWKSTKNEDGSSSIEVVKPLK